MPRAPFDSQDQIHRVWPYIDGLARKAWEYLPADDPRRKQVGDSAGALYNNLLGASLDLPREDRNLIPAPPRGIDADKDGWSQFARDEIINMLGREDISSVTEAFLKTTSLLRVLQSTQGQNQGRFLFRGQRNINWDLLPRKGRALIAAGWHPPEQHLCDRRLTKILSEELESLAVFRQSWETLDDIEDEDRQRVLPDNHPEWWFRMQHYDAGDGTRLLDVTTSLTSALLFACVDWEHGAVDEETDGVIYLWTEGQNGNVDDFLVHHLPQYAEGLFTQHPDAPRFILNPPHTERSKAQSGAFLWWPRFWEEPPYQAPFYLRVRAAAKIDIVRDLLSMGFGPKEAVRGIKGLQNEQRLRAQLGLPAWRPLQLQE